MFQVPEKYRIRRGPLASGPDDGNNGAFMIRSLKIKSTLFAIASDGGGWEHVSVSRQKSTPSWDEMCFIKDLFWGQEDCVVQFHPPASEYVNVHQHCLHLWRPTTGEILMPPSFMVGPKI